MDNLEQQLQQLRLIHHRITAGKSTNSNLNKQDENYEQKVVTKREVPNKKKQSSSLYGTLDNKKLSLDNPAVLDQQLEVLAHHKREMEKRGLLQNSTPELPKISNATEKLKTVQHQLCAQQSTLMLDTFADNVDLENSPPSPVSSSYSELRQATEISQPTQKVSTQVHSNKPEILNKNPVASGYYINFQYAPNNAANNEHVAVESPISHDSVDYYGFDNFSQASSLTYESIYEPINPRPASRMSSHSSTTRTISNNSLFYTSPPYTNLMASNTPTIDNVPRNEEMLANSQLSTPTQNRSYGEVDSFSAYLERSISTDCENFGNCCKCNERILGENSGCTAMDQVYHIECFTCTQCQINLQGKPFYAIENKAYCEYDYLQTLEKCSVCTKPILERILRATGKPYHPQCFCCVVCGSSLDGIPFTVDATNQNYCIADFHKKFAPRCCVCKDPIMPESGEEETVRVVALDRSFHLKCYKCEDCGLLLSSNSEGSGCYPLDDHVLCKSCNAKRVQQLIQ